MIVVPSSNLISYALGATIIISLIVFSAYSLLNLLFCQTKPSMLLLNRHKILDVVARSAGYTSFTYNQVPFNISSPEYDSHQRTTQEKSDISLCHFSCTHVNVSF